MPRAAAASLLIALLVSTADAQSKNLLFYGNSYSFFNGAVPPLVQLIAIEAGHPSPTIRQQLVGGQNLLHHATDPAQVAAITTSLQPGQSWDYVVMQGHSLEATAALGNPAQFRNSAVQIMANVRSHSPAARGVMYQTWARAIGHHLYPGTFAGPMVMHDEIRANYDLAAADINTAFGAGTALTSAVGDGVALLEWDAVYYNQDRTHPGPPMTLLASMCIYSSIYGLTVCELDPDFGQNSPLVLWLANQGLDESDWNQIAGIADRTAVATMRRYPGSGDHLLLETGTPPGPVTACYRNDMTVGTFVSMGVRSRNGVYDNAASWLLVNPFPTGSHPGPSTLYPEIQVNLGTMAILVSSTNLVNPNSFVLQMPFSWPGTSILVQGLAWAPSSESGNNVFTVTDAHEFVFF